jgi:tryptophan-rich sensory protein
MALPVTARHSRTRAAIWMQVILSPFSIPYLLMAFAAWLVWGEGGWCVQGRALGFFAVQLAHNALWTSADFAGAFR